MDLTCLRIVDNFHAPRHRSIIRQIAPIESEVELLESKGGDLFYLGYKSTEVGGSHVGFK